MINKKLLQIRTVFDYTQEQMAEILGVSRPTYSEIEKGNGEITLQSLRKLASKTGLSINSLLVQEDMVLEAQNDEALKKYKTMLLYALNCGADDDGKITKTKLAKLLYLLDFSWYYKHFKSMSGLTYRRIQYGPVPDQYFRVLEELLSERQIKVSTGDAHMISATEKSLPTHGLNKAEIFQIQEVCRKWKNKNTQDIVNFAHEQLPWKICKQNELIPYELIIQEDPEHVY
ncbi:MAG: type II toxin-antitoxin system antitoxin SocA domain-containing protein [Patescibacteria group bacterium]